MNEKDFPILNGRIHGKRLVYLDNAATNQKPNRVISAIKSHYEHDNSNTHREIHTLANRATEKYENARKIVANLFNANENEIVFTKGTTESLNLVAFGLKHLLKKGDEIVLTEMEHHSNIVPWQIIAKENGAKIKYIPITKNYELDMSAANKLINKKTKIVSVTHMSNVLGTINDVKQLAKLTHSRNKYAIFVVDAAQSAPHMKIDVKDIDCDFLGCSSHKMCGPTGVGVLYGKEKVLELLNPLNYGGHMINEVTFEKTTFAEIPGRFEAGTANIEGVIAFGVAIEYLNKIGMKNIEKYDKELIEYAINEIKKLNSNKIRIIGQINSKNRGSVLSLDIKGLHPHDASELLDREGIAVRGGHHCAMPLMKKLNLPGTTRASFYFYNTKKDVDRFILGLKKAMKVFNLG